MFTDTNNLCRRQIRYLYIVIKNPYNLSVATNLLKIQIINNL